MTTVNSGPSVTRRSRAWSTGAESFRRAKLTFIAQFRDALYSDQISSCSKREDGSKGPSHRVQLLATDTKTNLNAILFEPSRP